MTYTKEQRAAMSAKVSAMLSESGLSQNKFSARVNISPAMLTHIINSPEKDGLVGDGTWEVVSKLLAEKEGYNAVVTANLKKVYDTCERAYQLKKPMVVLGEGGLGKTFALKKYQEKSERRGKTVIYFDAATVRTRKQFVVGLMQALDCYEAGIISAQMDKITDYIKRRDLLLVIDEVSALEGHLVTVLKDIMTALKDLCGIVLSGTPYFINNLNRGAAQNFHLYSETRDRLFMLPERLEKPTEQEARAIFEANGITGDKLDIVMGKNAALSQYSWRSKPTFRGIRDCIDMLQMLSIKTDYEL
ncbi:MAG: ATP-binding protein [Prevotellaceae bacterium]|jgi:DNA transposition AAA+ family ATPase|nr:ATP-binding protein [Prevotellaceae bacterium]